ncbi:MAG: hypothetical protein HY042_05075, partial [Spirochaetia bacterium]|nr:hypothetical protein [Spirochaetia bacterium]
MLKQTGTATWRTARFTLILLALSWSNAGAEQVFYRNGKVVPGSVIGYDPATVTVNTGQGTIRIHKDELRRIYYAPTDEEVRKEEEAKKAEAKRKEEEAKRQEEETKRRAEAAKQREEDAKRAEEQKRKDQEEDRLKKEKEAREQAQKKEKQQAEELAAKERQKEEERLERSKG